MGDLTGAMASRVVLVVLLGGVAVSLADTSRCDLYSSQTPIGTQIGACTDAPGLTTADKSKGMFSTCLVKDSKCQAPPGITQMCTTVVFAGQKTINGKSIVAQFASQGCDTMNLCNSYQIKNKECVKVKGQMTLSDGSTSDTEYRVYCSDVSMRDQLGGIECKNRPAIEGYIEGGISNAAARDVRSLPFAIALTLGTLLLFGTSH